MNRKTIMPFALAEVSPEKTDAMRERRKMAMPTAEISDMLESTARPLPLPWNGASTLLHGR